MSGVTNADGKNDAGGASARFDWSALFAEAGLEQSEFQTVESNWTPPTEADERAAWDGSYRERPGERVHVEAAAYRGRPVYFEIIHPWDKPGRDVEYSGTPSQQRTVLVFVFAFFLLALAGGVLLALRNLRLGRGDHRGALRVTAVLVSARLLGGWAFGAHHFASPLEELLLFIEYLKSALFVGALAWLLYIALEPFVRRHWPERIISWSRLVAGGWRDPLVGRDVLVGAVGGVAYELCIHLAYLAPKWQGRAAGVPLYPDARMYGTSLFLNYLSHQIMMPVFFSLVILMVMFLLYVVTRRTRLAGALAFLVVLAAEFLTFGAAAPLAAPFIVAAALIEVGVLYRFGLLALVSLAFVEHLWVFFPVTTELSAWYASGFVLDALVCLALAFYGFYTSLAGQPLLRGDLLGD
jgi:serine/threonine-protein kinase